MTEPATDYPFVVAIAGSAGALEPLFELLAEVPVDLAAPIVLALHTAPQSDLITPLKMKLPHNFSLIESGAQLRPGTIHVPPAAQHVFIRGETLELSGPVGDSGFRPSMDALFMTLAASWGPKALAVVLSGLLQDGMRGSQVIYDMGGHTVVQDPDGAKFDQMPLSVIRNDHPDQILPPRDLGRWITRVVRAA